MKERLISRLHIGALSLNLAAEYDQEIAKVVSQACLLLCDGEYIDTSTKFGVV